MPNSDDHLVGRLPDSITHAILAGRKIDAIKQLRQRYNLGLKEAKHVVDEYIAENGEELGEEPQTVGITIERIVLLIIVAAIGYGLYDYLLT